MLDEALVL